MIGKAVGLIAGRSIARTLGLTAGATAAKAPLLPAVVGAALPTALRRVGPAALVAVAVGGLVARRLVVRHRRHTTEDATPASAAAPEGR